MPARSTEYPTPEHDVRIWDNCPGRTRDTPAAWSPVILRARGGIRPWSALQQRGTDMDDETQQRVITLVAAGIAYAISQAVTNRYIGVPDQRGIKDDALEAVLKGATTATSTILASIIVRRVLSGRWSG